MTDDAEGPPGVGAKPPQNGASHIAIAVQDKASKLNPAFDRAAQNSSLKRVNTHASILRTIEKRSQVVIRFQDVCAWVPTLVIPGGPGQASKLSCLRLQGKAKVGEEPAQQVPKERQILFSVSGEVNPGEVLALMGPSGGGKTSLLTLLAGRSTARLEGSITFNGAKMSKPVKRKLGYVMQDDMLFAELTVYETLYFAALLRLPRSWSTADKLSRVEMVVEGLGLERCRNTIIGSHMMRGVSGGERKRVSIGHELLINPSMLLLDEPTSGLDSTTALRLLHTLRTLASGGRTIVTSIHQPSSRLYRQMDKLMLLAQGHTMYYGDAQCVATWFKLLGQPCPFGTNIADHILDLANGDVANRGGGTATGLSDMATLRRRPGAGTAVIADDEDDGSDDRGSSDDRTATAGVGAATGTVRGPSAAPLSPSGARVPPGDLAETPEEVHRRLVAAFAQRAIGLGREGIRARELENADPEAIFGKGTAGAAAATAAAAAAAAKLDVQAGVSGGADGGVKGAEDAGSGGAKAEGAGVNAVVEAQPAEEADDKWGAPWLLQVKYLTLRSIKTRRFQSLSIQKFIQLIGVAVLAGMFWWQVGGKLDSVQHLTDIGGLLFFIQLFMGFASLYAALFTFPLEFQMLVKERQSGMYRLSAYYVARTASDLPMDCLLPSLFVWIVYWMAGLRISAGAFFAHWASVILIVLTSQSVGLLIGATVMQPQNGQTIATIFMLGTMLVGGYYVRGIPVWISWLKYVSFIYWGWNLLLKIEFRDRHFPCYLVPPETGGGGPGDDCNVAQSATFQVNVQEAVTAEVCILIGMLIFLRLCIYYALQYKTTFKGRK